ncbi:MAG TPA: MltA domain-containing protein [Marinagarivorans sp.]
MTNPMLCNRVLYPHILLIAITLALGACTSSQKAPQKAKTISLEQSSFQALPNWSASDPQGALLAFKNSCGKILARNSLSSHQNQPMLSLADLQYACTQAATWHGSARQYFEQHFEVFTARFDGSRESFFTGYYEPELKASRTQTTGFNAPIYALPDDLITVNLGDFDSEWQGKKLWGRVDGQQLKPYWTREEIHHKGIPAKPIAWAADSVDVFFLHIQGSGLLDLGNGETMRVGFAGRNGQPYTAIGKPLIEQGELDAATVSMQSIRAWLANNPKRAQSVMNLNQSYIFFRPLETTGPVGAHGVPLTAEHSIAVDPAYWHYGLPLYISAENPINASPLNKLLVTQDTGSAIKGPLRGDVFWGSGAYAADMAGKMKSQGVTWVLLPKKAVK